jgi:acetyl/propionyl-CoA carboxylase alpha subunit
MSSTLRLRKVLVANRGEIARRIIRACRRLGVASAAVYSDADEGAPHVRDADEAVAIGPAPARQSYLSIDAVLDAARRVGADAIHPGYGFLSENWRFAQACRDAGLTFVGPSAEAIRLMGDKIEARRLMAAAGVPVLPGSEGSVHDAAEAERVAAHVGYPVLLKAAGGGGGIGMARVDGVAGLATAYATARRRAEAAFGDPALYVERYAERARHVEVQVFGGAASSISTSGSARSSGVTRSWWRNRRLRTSRAGRRTDSRARPWPAPAPSDTPMLAPWSSWSMPRATSGSSR